MGYFKYLSLFFGVYFFLAWTWILIFPQKYKDWGMRFIPEKRPGWFAPVSWAMFAWVLYTWYLCSRFPSPVSLAVTFILTIMLIKPYYILFKYSDFREFARIFLSAANPIFRVFALFGLALAACFLAMGLTM